MKTLTRMEQMANNLPPIFPEDDHGRLLVLMTLVWSLRSDVKELDTRLRQELTQMRGELVSQDAILKIDMQTLKEMHLVYDPRVYVPRFDHMNKEWDRFKDRSRLIVTGVTLIAGAFGWALNTAIQYFLR